MTVEQAKEILEPVKEEWNMSLMCPMERYEALNLAIKSLEAWDKIRIEIETLEYLNIEDGSDGYDKYIEKYEVIKIIDKYKADKESD